MLIKYTKESFDHKPIWETECKHLHWRQHQGGFFEYIYLWQTGHIMDIGDNELMDFIIVDIDNLPAGKREWLNTNCAAIANALDVRSCHVFDSSSRHPDKCKVYLELFIPIAVNDMEVFLTEFEIYCDVEVDKCTKSAYQLNYGIMLNSPDYLIDTSVFYADIPSVRSTKKGQKDIFLPVNQQEKNRLLGKKAYTDPRLEWNYYKFIKHEGKIVRDTILIKEGQRQKTLNLLIKIVMFNACMYNKYYNKTYTVDEVYNKVKMIMALQFDQAKQFIFENKRIIYQTCYNEWHEQMSRNIPELYTELCSMLNKKENYSYIPREFSAAAIYRSIKDSLAELNKDEVIDRIGYIAEGDELIINRILRYYNKDKFNGIRKDKGKKHNYPKVKTTIEYEEFLNSLTIENGKYLIPKTLITSKLRKFLSRNNKKYTSI